MSPQTIDFSEYAQPATADQQPAGDQLPPPELPPTQPAPAQAPATAPPQTGQQPGQIDFSQYATDTTDTTDTSQAEEPSALHRFGESFLQHGMGITSNEEAKSFFEHPINTLISMFERQGQLAADARDAYRKGDYAGAVMHGLNYLVPFIGQTTDIAGRQLQKGDIAGGMGTTAGLATTLVAGSPEGRAAVGGAAREAGAAVKAGARAAVKEAPTAIGLGLGGKVGAAMGEPFGGAAIGGYLGRKFGQPLMQKLFAQAGEPSAEAQAALETITPEQVQPSLQSGVRGILNDVAKDEGIQPVGDDVLLRDAGEDLAGKMEVKSHELFKPLDDATNNEYTKLQDAIKSINRKLQSPAAADPDVEFRLEEQRAGLKARLDEATEIAKKKGVDPALADQGREAFKKMSALLDFDTEMKRVMPGRTQVRGENVDPARFVDSIQKLRDNKPFGTRRLDDALGPDNAKRMLEHARDMQRTVTEKPAAAPGPETTTTAPAPTDISRPALARTAAVAGRPEKPQEQAAEKKTPGTPAKQEAAKSQSDADGTNVWQAFPNDDQLVNHLAKMEVKPKAGSNNPGNLKDPKTGEIRMFSSMEEGRAALIRQLKSWRAKHPDWSIADFNRNYAPDRSHGGDNPEGTEADRNRYLMNALSAM